MLQGVYGQYKLDLGFFLSFFLFFFVGGISSEWGQTYEDWEVNVIGAHNVKLPNNQWKYFVGKKLTKTIATIGYLWIIGCHNILYNNEASNKMFNLPWLFHYNGSNFYGALHCLVIHSFLVTIIQVTTKILVSVAIAATWSGRTEPLYSGWSYEQK